MYVILRYMLFVEIKKTLVFVIVNSTYAEICHKCVYIRN